VGLALAAWSFLQVVGCGPRSNFGNDAGTGKDASLGFGDGSSEAGPPVDKCHVPPDDVGDDAPVCSAPPKPPNSFDPKIKWTWTDPNPYTYSFEGTEMTIHGSIVTPLVANLTDDNGDGEVNLCDVPDVIVASGGGPPGAHGTIFMLAGDTGKLEKTFDLQGGVDTSVTPALGDLDGDGVPEVVAEDSTGHLVAFDNAGHVKWKSPTVGAYFTTDWTGNTSSYCQALAIYDLDGDGSPEIIAAFEVYDNHGNLKFAYDESAFAGQYWCPASIAADLDGDGKMEVIFGNAALHADGSTYWTIPGPPGQPQVANFDANPDPEIFISRQDGVMIVSHDGKILSGPVQLFDPGPSPNCWSKPGVVQDFDGDGHADISDSSCDHVAVYHVGPSFQLTTNWTPFTVDDTSGLASSTAFDFLGRGVADGVYGDQTNLWVFDGMTGGVELSASRASGTLIEYPVVADVDNDGSADIVVVSNEEDLAPIGNYQNTVAVYEDSQKRWIPTRRIWNQHAYSVTNVREDGTIPAHPKPSWLGLNTFRTNAELQAGQNCAPPPPNPH